jgi:hypothetical protein
MIALPVGGVLLVVCALLGHPAAGAFLLVGLVLGAFNSMLVQRSVVTYASATGHGRKKRFIGGVLVRLGGVTLLALLAILLVRPDGLGLLAGVGLFQLIMLIGATMPLIKELRA